MARGLARRGHAQQIAAPPGSELARRAAAEGFAIAPLSPARLRESLKGVQILHAHTGRAQNIAWLASVGLPVKRIVTRHVAFEPRHPLVHRLKYARTCDGIIAVSQAARHAMVTAGVSGDRIEVIPTGVEIPALPDERQRAEARQAWNLQPGDFAAGHLGAFTREKGQEVAIEAARLLAEKLPNLRMILAGEGPLRASLPRHPNVILPGYVAEPGSLLAALDVFLMPSRSEGWGLAALEAMAYALPVIASDAGGLTEIVETGQTGWLVPADDAQALADAILAASKGRDRLREMGLAARERARAFSIEETARRTEEFYLRALSGSRQSNSASERRT